MTTLGTYLSYIIHEAWPSRPRRKPKFRRPRLPEIHFEDLPVAAIYPWRSREYRKFVREHACCACGSWKYVEPAHIGPHALGSKAGDQECVPLCAWCHTGKQGNLHQVGRRLFELAHQIKFSHVIRQVRAEWRERA